MKAKYMVGKGKWNNSVLYDKKGENGLMCDHLYAAYDSLKQETKHFFVPCDWRGVVES